MILPVQWRWHCQQICSKFTSLSSARQIYHWPARNSLNSEFAYFSSPYSSHPWISHCSKNVMFCFHWWLTIHQWTEFSISNSTYVQISCVKYIPLLCWIWPDFIQKSSLFCQQSLGMIQTHVPNFFKSPYSLDDKIRAIVQLITYTVPQNCLSLFTIHCNSLFPYVQLTSVVELSVFFFVEGRHLSKIQLGTNVTRQNNILIFRLLL